MVTTGSFSVPVIITWDVDPDEWVEPEKKRRTLQVTAELCNKFNIPATFFITAKPAEMYADMLPALLTAGH